MNDWQKKELAECSPMYKGVLTKAYAGKASPRAAIRAFCLHCTGYERAVITNCTSWACPLHAYRPYVGKDSAEGVEDTEIAAESSEIQVQAASGGKS